MNTYRMKKMRDIEERWKKVRNKEQVINENVIENKEKLKEQKKQNERKKERQKDTNKRNGRHGE
jgi:hypothetical protein